LSFTEYLNPSSTPSEYVLLSVIASAIS